VRLFVVGRLDGRTVEAPKPQRVRLPYGPQIIDTVRGWTRVDSKSLDVRWRVESGRRNIGARAYLTQHVTDHPGRSLDRPIGTVTCASGHWCLVDGAWMRTLTPRELARAQGMRDSLELPAEVGLATRLVGNAVPPPLAAAVIKAALSGVVRQMTLGVA
jgi:site-specific DNA-cytosine methylase